MAAESKTSVVAAIAGNTLVCIAKFTAFAITGSGAMLSEAIHTLADVMNQVLLLVGIVRSERPADRLYRYGYGQERFVWALVSAVGIFFLGCGVTVYHGITSLLHPHEVSGLGIAVGVLIFSLVVEGIVLFIAFKGLREGAQKAEQPFFVYLREGADPSAVAVLLEDAAACLGVLIALTCILLVQVTGQPWWDAVGSILIGVLLGFVAIFLIARNRELLIGRSMPEVQRVRIRDIVLKRASVEALNDIKSIQLDTHTYDVVLDVKFDGEVIAGLLEAEIQQGLGSVEDPAAFKTWAATYADRVMECVGAEIDALEAQIREVVPEAKHIDIEPQ